MLIAGADIDTEQLQQLASATPTSVQSRDPTCTAGTRRTATTLDSAPGSGTFGTVEAASVLDSSRHADAGNRAAGLLVDRLDSVVCSALLSYWLPSLASDSP